MSGRWFFVDESQPRDIEREYECDWNVLGSANADSQDLAELRSDLEDVASTGDWCTSLLAARASRGRDLVLGPGPFISCLKEG